MAVNTKNTSYEPNIINTVYGSFRPYIIEQNEIPKLGTEVNKSMLSI